MDDGAGTFHTCGDTSSEKPEGLSWRRRGDQEATGARALAPSPQHAHLPSGHQITEAEARLPLRSSGARALRMQMGNLTHCYCRQHTHAGGRFSEEGRACWGRWCCRQRCAEPPPGALVWGCAHSLLGTFPRLWEALWGGLFSTHLGSPRAAGEPQPKFSSRNSRQAPLTMGQGHFPFLVFAF